MGLSMKQKTRTRILFAFWRWNLSALMRNDSLTSGRSKWARHNSAVYKPLKLLP